MPVFDDPKKELRRLHEQLLAEEEELDDLVEEYGEGDYREFFDEDDEEEYFQEPFIRNYSNRYGSDIRNFANGYRGEKLFDQEDEDQEWDNSDEEPYAVFVETKRERKRRIREEQSKQENRGGGFLKFMLVLELMGLLGILFWWVVNVW